MQTQWRVSFSGRYGLDYAGVRAYLDELGFDGERRRDVFAGILACERATLDVQAERRSQE